MKRFLILFSVILTVFLLDFGYALAVIGEGDFRFRVDDQLNTAITGAYARIRCSGDTVLVVADGSGNDSNGTAGIIDIASTTAGFTAESGGAGCATNSETINVSSASFPGYIWTTSNILTSYSTTALNNGGSSLSFSLKITAVEQELQTALTINGTAASSSVAAKTTTYSGGAGYIPVKVSDGSFTLTIGGDGYVNKTLTAITIASRSQQTAHFDDGTDAGANDWVGNRLPFGHKITVNESGGGPITVGTVTAGDSSGTTCTAGTGSNAGNRYCAVPLANTATTATFRHDDFESATATYTDRATGSDAQTTATINAFKKPSSGGGGVPFTPTPTPTPTPTSTPTPELTPAPTPTPEPQTVEEKMVLIRAKILELQTRLAELLGQKNLPTPPVQAPPAYGLFNFTRALHSGIRGEEVKALQDYLKSTGHFGSSVESTGYFGQLTKEAVAAWQRDNGVSPAEGYFGFRSQLKYRALTQ